MKPSQCPQKKIKKIAKVFIKNADTINKDKKPKGMIIMNPINNSFSTSRYSGYAGRKAYSYRKQNESDAESIFRQDKTDKTEKEDTAQTAKLSKKAQSVLDALVAKYGENTSFIVQNFKSAEEAKDILSDSSSEFSVLLTPDELEKMADDKGYMKEKLDSIDGAMRMSEQINAQFGFTSADKNALVRGDISKIGVSFDSDGKMTLFADLERTVKEGNEKAEAAAKKRTYQNRNDKGSKYSVKKKAVVSANSAKEMLEKLKAFSWKNVTEVEEKTDSGYLWNFEA